MIIKVTAEHIAKGEPNTLCRAPLALAAADAGLDIPWVSDDRKWLVYGRPQPASITLPDFGEISKPLSRRARKFIRDFDAGRPVQPFEFEL